MVKLVVMTILKSLSPGNQNDNGNDEPLCVYGHREKFRRRKQDAKCFVNKLFEDIKVIEDPCQCTEHDFECGPDLEFWKRID